MSGIAYEVLIVSVLLISCSLLTSSSIEIGPYDDIMHTSNDMQCLAQMPIVDLMKIQNAIKMMHAVSAYDAKRLSNLTASPIDYQNYNESHSGLLRELPADETRHMFRYYPRFARLTTKSPLAEPFMMTSQVHEAMKNNELV